MPFALLIIGVWLLIAGIRNTAGPVSQQGTLFNLFHGDFTGSDNFAYWFVAIVLIGAIGYIPRLRSVSVAFLTLVLVVLFLKKGNSSGVGGGFFNQFLSALNVTSTSGGPIAANNVLANLEAQNQNVMLQQQQISNTIQQQMNQEIP